MQLSRSFPVTEKDSSLFFEKKHLSDSGVPLQDCESEAEAAASAVAVAAISSDEIVGNGLGLVKETKTYGGAGITTGKAEACDTQEWWIMLWALFNLIA